MTDTITINGTREKLDRYSDVRGLTREGAIRRLLVLHDDCWGLIYDNENKADRIEALEAENERLLARLAHAEDDCEDDCIYCEERRQEIARATLGDKQ